MVNVMLGVTGGNITATLELSPEEAELVAKTQNGRDATPSTAFLDMLCEDLLAGLPEPQFTDTPSEALMMLGYLPSEVRANDSEVTPRTLPHFVRKTAEARLSKLREL